VKRGEMGQVGNDLEHPPTGGGGPKGGNPAAEDAVEQLKKKKKKRARLRDALCAAGIADV
jgi:hypothetical protein